MNKTHPPDGQSGQSRLLTFRSATVRLPWWLIAAVFLAAIFVYIIFTDADYRVIFSAVAQGIGVTIRVSLISYALSMILGLLIGLARLSSHRSIQEISSFYVEIIRGVPMLVLLYYIVFVGAPSLVNGVNVLGAQLAELGMLSGVSAALLDLSVRDVDFTVRVILALSVAYSAFLSEVFRAGIQSIEQGQVEAARSLGMSYWQAMRHVILPQAIRRVLPPLGNDFIAMLKDSSLVSVMGVADITFQGKVYAASTFQFFETYNVVAFLYLVMTISLALVLRYTEQRMAISER